MLKQVSVWFVVFLGLSCLTFLCFTDLSPGLSSSAVRYIKLALGELVAASAPSGDAARMFFTPLSAVPYIILVRMKR